MIIKISHSVIKAFFLLLTNPNMLSEKDSNRKRNASHQLIIIVRCGYFIEFHAYTRSSIALSNFIGVIN